MPDPTAQANSDSPAAAAASAPPLFSFALSHLRALRLWRGFLVQAQDAIHNMRAFHALVLQN
jgi:hypothetical protein